VSIDPVAAPAVWATSVPAMVGRVAVDAIKHTAKQARLQAADAAGKPTEHEADREQKSDEPKRLRRRKSSSAASRLASRIRRPLK